MNMPHSNYQDNIMVQECFQQQVSIHAGTSPRGPSVVPLAVSTPMETSLPQSPPQVTTPSPGLTSQPVSLSSSTLENLPAMVSVPASIQHDMNKRQTNDKETEQVPANVLEASLHYCAALGQGAHIMISYLEKLKSSQRAESELRAENEALKDEINSLKLQKEEIAKKAEEDIQKSKTEEASWRYQCMELNAQQMDLKSELDEKDRKMLSFEMSERKLKKELDEKEKDHEVSAHSLENERDSLKLMVEKLQNRYSKIANQFFAISKEVEEENTELHELQKEKSQKPSEQVNPYSSSSEKESSPPTEPSSSSMEVNGEKADVGGNDTCIEGKQIMDFVYQNVVQEAKIDKRKTLECKTGAAKKLCKEANLSNSRILPRNVAVSFQEISQMIFKQKAYGNH